MQTIEEGLYWVQEQAPNGGWIDRTGFKAAEDGLERARQSAAYSRAKWPLKPVRIITKTITIIEEVGA